VRVDSTNLDITANGTGTGFSAGTDFQGFAVLAAAEKLLKRLEP
jgi:xanthine dehydrogenase molybdopterin-binding subunit B